MYNSIMKEEGILKTNKKDSDKANTDFMLPSKKYSKNFETDSMVNNEDQRVERLISKNLTNQHKQPLLRSRFEKFFNTRHQKQPSECETEDLMKGLSIKRDDAKSKSVIENITSRLITSKNLNFIDPSKYFSKIEPKYISCKLNNPFKLQDYYQEQNSEFNNKKPFVSSNMVTLDKVNLGMLIQIKNDESSNNIKLIEAQKSKEASEKTIFQFRDKSCYSSGINFFDEDHLMSFNKLVIEDTVNEEPNLEEKDILEDFNIENMKDILINEFSSYAPIFQSHKNMNHQQKKVHFANDEKETVYISPFEENLIRYFDISDFFDYLLSTEEIKNKKIISNYFILSNSTKEKLGQIIFTLIEKFLFFSYDSRDYFFSLIDVSDKMILIKNIKYINFMPLCLSSNYKFFIEFLDKLKKYDKKLIQEIFSLINHTKNWKILILDKNGKNIVEYFVSNFCPEENTGISSDTQLKSLSLNKLSKVIDSNIIEYSKGNFSTFATQAFIQKTKNVSTAYSILENIQLIASCRNGVFTVISALKSYTGDILYLLLDKIIQLSEIFAKDMYSSTLIEFIFKNFTAYCIPKFILNKGSHFLELIEDPFGNYIIQKLLTFSSGKQKSELIDKLKTIVSKIKRNNIKNKWKQILYDHSSQINPSDNNQSLMNPNSYVENSDKSISNNSTSTCDKKSKKSKKQTNMSSFHNQSQISPTINTVYPLQYQEYMSNSPQMHRNPTIPQQQITNFGAQYPNYLFIQNNNIGGNMFYNYHTQPNPSINPMHNYQAQYYQNPFINYPQIPVQNNQINNYMSNSKTMNNQVNKK